VCKWQDVNIDGLFSFSQENFSMIPPLIPSRPGERKQHKKGRPETFMRRYAAPYNYARFCSFILLQILSNFKRDFPAGCGLFFREIQLVSPKTLFTRVSAHITDDDKLSD
jgi:hypothetical protein